MHFGAIECARTVCASMCWGGVHSSAVYMQAVALQCTQLCCFINEYAAYRQVGARNELYDKLMVENDLR